VFNGKYYTMELMFWSNSVGSLFGCENWSKFQIDTCILLDQALQYSRDEINI